MAFTSVAGLTIATAVDPLDEIRAHKFDERFLEGLSLSGFEDPLTRKLLEVEHVMKRAGMETIVPILSLLLSLKGEPYGLDRTTKRMPDGEEKVICPGYFPFEPFYRTRMPRKTLLKTGRQVAKSTNLAARGIVHSVCEPFFSTLYITPLFEQVRRFSANYVGPFIEQSPIRSLLVDTGVAGSVLQRTFRNNAKMIFSFAYLNADRTRGVSADKNSFDEVQDIDKDFLPIIAETMSGSRFGGITEMAGTPKGMENTMQGEWSSCSQAEWVTKCHHCGYWNIAAKAYDLDRMTGPMREDISYDRPAVVCAKCGRSILPHFGRWVHAFPERRWKYSGFHVPQQIMPMHYANKEKWSTLIGKREGKGNTPENVFYNEVAGESHDTGSRIITLTELERACVLPWNNTYAEAKAVFSRETYPYRVLGVDWGGGGEDGMSYTTYAVLGMKPDGRIDVIMGFRSLTPHDHAREARLAVGLAYQFSCQAIAHDYTGAGSLRETFVVQAGFPVDRIVPVAYHRAAAMARVMAYKPATKMNPRPYYLVDKSRSLLLTCNQIKTGWVRFFRNDFVNADDPGLIRDFIALVDEKTDSRLGKDIYTIIRDPNMRDDFAQSVNIGACTLWQMSDKWPNIAFVANLRVPQALLDAVHPDGTNVFEGLY